MYMKWNNGLFVTSYNPIEGYKPILYTQAPEAPEGYCAEFYWRETEDAWVQTWEINKIYDEISDEESLSILLGGTIT